MSINIPLGTYVSDGVRTGPFYTGQLPQGFVANTNGVITSSSHNNYGPGVLLSTQHTYNITPAAPGAGFTRTNNLVGRTDIGAIQRAMDLPLLGDNRVSYFNNGVVQLDWPRVPLVRIFGDNVPDGTRITIFGEDFYSFPLQHTYAFTIADGTNVPGVYPDIDIPTHSISVPAKAFYRINRVFISNPLSANNAQVELGLSDMFGLPYRTDDEGDVTSIGWGALSDLAIIGATLAPKGVYSPADILPSSPTSGDVRGLYAPSDAADGLQNLRFTYYVRGADTWINQVANQQMLYMQQTGSARPQGVPVLPLTQVDQFGVPQYYTGSPS